MQHLGVTRAHTLSMVHPLMSTMAGIVLFGEVMSVERQPACSWSWAGWRLS